MNIDDNASFIEDDDLNDDDDNEENEDATKNKIKLGL